MPGKTRSILYFALLGVLLSTLFLGTGLFGTGTPPATPPAAAELASPAEDAQLTAPGADVAAEPRPSAPPRQVLVRLEGPGYNAKVSNLTGGLARLELTDPRYVDEDGKPIQLVSTERPEYLPFQFSFEGATLPENVAWDIEPIETGVRLQQRTDALQIERKLEPGEGPYQLWLTTTVENIGEAPTTLTPHATTYHYVAREDEGGGFLAVRSPAISHGLCTLEGETERLDRDDMLKHQTFSGAIDFTGLETTYFLNAMAPTSPQATVCELRGEDRGGTPDKPHGSLLWTSMRYPEITLQPGQAQTFRVLAYMGPKTADVLETAGHELHRAIDLGFFASISQGLTWLLRAIHGFVGNWGIAIILLTVFVKLVLYPLTEKSFRSMAQIRQLKPEMDRINAQYADDREKKGAAIMELYRKHKINPMGGCLPQLLQLPIWFALYTSLSTNVELFRAPFMLWWTDLSRPDPFFVLPLALGLLMFLQQKMTPTAMDPAQAKIMMYVMPIMITSFMLFLPAGLGLYMFTNSALSIGQQQLIERRLAARAHAASASDSTGDSQADDGSADSTPTTASSRPGKGKPRKNVHRRSRRG